MKSRIALATVLGIAATGAASQETPEARLAKALTFETVSHQSEDEFEPYFDYIHFNPVKHGLVSRVSDWPHSSFHRDLLCQLENFLLAASDD